MSSTEEPTVTPSSKGQHRPSTAQQVEAFLQKETELEQLSPLSRHLQAAAPTETGPPLFDGNALTFRGSYRRFFVFLVFFCFALAIGLFFTLRALAWIYVEQWTLGLTSAFAIFATLMYLFGSYRRRSITIDTYGISYTDELRSLLIRWEDINSIHLHAVAAFFNPYPLCYVRLVTEQEEEFGFSSFGRFLFGIQRGISFGNPPYPIIDIRDADLLLALLIQHAPAKAELPDLERIWYRAQQSVEEQDEETTTPTTEKESSSASSARSAWLGLWTLGAKIGLKFLPHLPKTLQFALKTIKPTYVGLSVGLYAVFFTWQFALLLCFILLVHEWGHVWAMHKEGMEIRGVYFIPFFGAATVTDDVWKSWGAQARVNIAGPLWGLYGVILSMALYAVTASNFWLGAALWGALVNFLNLLPVHPLDGGRILNAMAYSLQSYIGYVIILAILIGTAGLGLFMGLFLLYILACIGLAEFVKEYGQRQRADAFSYVHNFANWTPHQLLSLKSITSINFGDRNAPYMIEQEEVALKRLHLILHAPKMTEEEIAKTGFMTLTIAVLLFGLLLYLQHIPGTRWALQLFQ